MSSSIPKQKSRLASYFGDERKVDILFSSLAKKLLREGRDHLPPQVFAKISGIPEKEWQQLFSANHSIVNDIMSAPVQATLKRLEKIERSESNFIEKLSGILSLIYSINCTYPEIMILFQGFSLNRKLDSKYSISGTMEKLILQSMLILRNQAREEGIVKPGSSMESLLFFLVRQLLETMQSRVFGYCEEYLETGDHSCFPPEEDVVDSLMAPVKEQLAGLTAI